MSCRILLRPTLLNRTTAAVFALGAAYAAGMSPLPSHAEVPPASAYVVTTPNASSMERMAGREVRRYLYTRTGRMVPFLAAARPPESGDIIVVARRDRPILRALGMANVSRGLGPQQYALRTLKSGGRTVLAVVGGDDAGTLYGAYRLAEKLGVRFYLHGDTIPDKRLPFALPSLNERGKPLFELRGIQPFHDFPEGPDWWNTAEYLSVIGQLPKLRMNFIGLHTYPQGSAGPEATVWIGRPQDARPDGTVTGSYSAFYHNTALGTWGYAPKKTGDFAMGASMLFDRDKYGPDVIRGFEPRPTTPEDSNALFNRSADMLNTAFRHAHALGVKTCVGTETPLTIPTTVRERLQHEDMDPSTEAAVRTLYEGVFRRAASAYPLDYYWLWTPEGWTWSGASKDQVDATVRDLNIAYEALKASGAPFQMATSGWVLGPQDDRALLDKVLPKDVPVSAINRQVGMMPVEPAFANVSGRGKWAIPWMEDDPALTQVQLWAGRMRADAMDALRYGCTGLMGIHWRTRALSMNVGALAAAAWDQSWAQDVQPPKEFTDGQTSAYYQSPMADTEDDFVYQDVRYGMSAYRLAVPNGTYTVTLRFVEPHYDKPGVRVFDVAVESRKVLRELDVFKRVGKDRALDFTYNDVRVLDGKLDIEFLPRVEMPCMAAFDVVGPVTRRINCGGPAHRGWEADLDPFQRDTQTVDFYKDWARAEFGEEVAPRVADILSSVDGKLPRPSAWVGGPGGLTPDPRPWREVRTEYAFVNRLAALRPDVRGTGSLSRFDYWLSTFLFLESLGRLKCEWGAYNKAMEPVTSAQNAAEKARLAREAGLPARRALVRAMTDSYRYLLATVSTTGELGTVANFEQRSVPAILEKPGKELEEALGEALPSDAVLPAAYFGPTRIIVPAPRSSVAVGEAQQLRVIVLSQDTPKDAALFWSPMGKGNFRKVPLRQRARGVYTVALPSATGDYEYYVRVTPATGAPAVWPAGAPSLSHTVILGPVPDNK